MGLLSPQGDVLSSLVAKGSSACYMSSNQKFAQPGVFFKWTVGMSSVLKAQLFLACVMVRSHCTIHSLVTLWHTQKPWSEQAVVQGTWEQSPPGKKEAHWQGTAVGREAHPADACIAAVLCG